MTIERDLQKLSPGSIVELFEIDATGLGGGITRLHNGANELKSPVIWQGNTYQPFPIEAQGFEFTGKGQLPRPTVRVANVTGLVGALVREYQDLLGAKFTRKRTLVKYLDGDNFARALYGDIPGVTGSFIRAAGTVAASITGDIEIIFKMRWADWTPATISYFFSKYVSVANGSWAISIAGGSNGRVNFEWVDAGGTLRSTQSSVAVTVSDNGDKWLRIRLDVDNGAGGHAVTFDEGEDGVAWSQIGTPRNAGAFTTSIKTSAANINLGASFGVAGAATALGAGRVYYAEIRNGIGGPVVASFDARDANKGATTVTSSQSGETWDILSTATLAGGYNPTADPDAHLPDDIYFVDRKSAENKVIVEFELAAAFDVTGVKLPRRFVVQNVCPWRYRGADCGYVGGTYFDANDQQVFDVSLDVCGKRLASCKKRFGEFAELPFGGFPAAGLVR